MNPALIGTLFKFLEPVLDSVLGHIVGGDKYKDQIKLKLLDNEGSVLDFAKQWLKADTNGAWYQKAWRPLFMYLFMVVLFLYLVFDPLLFLATDLRLPKPQLDAIPLPVWDIILYGFGIYSGGRSLEKVTSMYTESKKAQVDIPLETTPYKQDFTSYESRTAHVKD